MIFDKYGQTATPGERSECPMCDTPLVAKCGQMVTWHWAHLAAECDPWSEPESEWHLSWKRWYLDKGARVEVPMGDHRADVVLPNGKVIELQSNYLGVADIEAREDHYGPRMVWIYRCHWKDRIIFGKRGFRWSHGAKSMTTHRRPVWWDVPGTWGDGDPDPIVRVSLALVENEDYSGDTYERVVGRAISCGWRDLPDIRETGFWWDDAPQQFDLFGAA